MGVPYIGIFWSSLLTLPKAGRLTVCGGYLCMESNYSRSIHCIFMIFTELLYRVYGNILPEFYLICMRIDDVTVAGAYKEDHIFRHLSTGDSYRAEFRLCILPEMDKTIKSVLRSFLTYFQIICELLKPLWISNFYRIHASKSESNTSYLDNCTAVSVANIITKIEKNVDLIHI